MITPLSALGGLALYFVGIFVFALMWRRREARDRKLADQKAAEAANYHFDPKSYVHTVSGRL
jgi:hypothetical protein